MASAAKKNWGILRQWCLASTRGSKTINAYLSQFSSEGPCVSRYELNPALGLKDADFVLTPFDAAKWDPDIIDKTDWFDRQQRYFDAIVLNKEGCKTVYPVEEFGYYYVNHYYSEYNSPDAAAPTTVFSVQSRHIHFDDDTYGNLKKYLNASIQHYVGTTYSLFNYVFDHSGGLTTGDLPAFSGAVTIPMHPSLVGVLGGVGFSSGCISKSLRFTAKIGYIAEDLFGETFTRAENSPDAVVNYSSNDVLPAAGLKHKLTLTISSGPWFVSGTPNKDLVVVAKNNANFRFKGSLIEIQKAIADGGLEPITLEIPVQIGFVVYQWPVREIEVRNDLIYVYIEPQPSANLPGKVMFNDLRIEISYIPDFEFLKGKSLGIIHGRKYAPHPYPPLFDPLDPNSPVGDITEEWAESTGYGTVRYEWGLFMPMVEGYLDPLGGRYADSYSDNVVTTLPTDYAVEYLGERMDLFPTSDLTAGREKPLVYPDTLLNAEHFSAIRYYTKEKLWAKRRRTWAAMDNAFLHCILLGAPTTGSRSPYYDGRSMQGVTYADGTMALLDRVDAFFSKDISRSRALVHIQPVLLDGTPTKMECCMGDTAYYQGSAIREAYVKPCSIFDAAPWIARKVLNTPAISAAFIAQPWPNVWLWNKSGSIRTLQSGVPYFFDGSTIVDPLTGTPRQVWSDLMGTVPPHHRKCINWIMVPGGPHKTPADLGNTRVEYSSYTPANVGGFIPENGRPFLWNAQGQLALTLDWLVSSSEYTVAPRPVAAASVRVNGGTEWSTQPALPTPPVCPMFSSADIDNVYTRHYESNITEYDDGPPSYTHHWTWTASQSGWHSWSSSANLTVPSGKAFDSSAYSARQGVSLVDRTQPSGSATNSGTGTSYSLPQFYELPFNTPVPAGYFEDDFYYVETDYIPYATAWGTNVEASKLVTAPDAKTPFNWLMFSSNYDHKYPLLPIFAMLTNGIPLWWDAEREETDTRWIAEPNVRQYTTQTVSRLAVNKLNFIAFVGKAYNICHIGGALKKAVNMEPAIGKITGGTYTGLKVGIDKLILVDKSNELPIEVAVMVINEQDLFTLKIGDNYGRSNVLISSTDATGQAYCYFHGKPELDVFSMGVTTSPYAVANPTETNVVYLWADNLRIPTSAPPTDAGIYGSAWRYKHSEWVFAQGIVDTSKYTTTKILSIDFSVTGMPNKNVEVILGDVMHGELPIATAHFVRDDRRECFYLDLSKTLHDIPMNVGIGSYFWLGLRDSRIPGMVVKALLDITFLPPGPVQPVQPPAHPGSVDPPVSNSGGGPTV